MTMMGSVTAAAAWLAALTLTVQDAPIVQPGAPGEAATRLTPEASVEMSDAGYTEADIAFMQDMIVHHGQAVEMVALIEARTENEAVRAMGARISLSQSSEIELMQNWLLARGQSTESKLLKGGGRGDHDMGGHKMDHGDMDPMDMPLMHGMLSPRQMKTLAAADGLAFDRLFLLGMIQHHQGALDMVDMLLADPSNGQDALLSEFLSSIVGDQSAEILRMQTLLSALGSPS